MKKSGDEYIDDAIAWARQARRRTRTHCKFISGTAAKFMADLSAPPRPFDMSADAVARFCRLIENLPHTKGAQFSGNIKLQPWQIFHFVNIFGWGAEINGRWRRKHSIAFTQVAKKSGKSTMAAPVGIYMISPLEAEPGAEVYCAASKRDQASIVLDQARAMLAAAPAVRSELKMSVWAKHVECEFRGSINRMVAISSDRPQTDDGINPNCVIMDELHAMRDGELRGNLIKGTIARENGLAYEITTAGELRDESPCLSENAKARKILAGELDMPEFFGMIFEQDDPTLEIKRPATWLKSNPSLDVTIEKNKLLMIRSDAGDSPMLQNHFIQKHLNCFTGKSESWLQIEKWRGNEKRPGDKPPDLPLFLGFDLSSVSDLTAVGYCWLDDAAAGGPEYWIAADSFATKHAASQNPHIKKFCALGQITIIGDQAIDLPYLREHILKIGDTDNVIEIGFDPWGAAVLAEELAIKFQLVEVRMGAPTLSAPMKNFEAGLRSGKIHILGDAALAWQAGNLTVRADRNDNWAPDKKSGGNKIDAMVAILIAFTRAYKFVIQPEIQVVDIIAE